MIHTKPSGYPASTHADDAGYPLGLGRVHIRELANLV